jgi:ATP-binding cassette subfamily B protein
MKLILDFWKKKKRLLLLLVLFTAVSTGVTLSFPYILRYIIDGIQNHLAAAKILRFVAILLGFGLARSAISALLPMARGRTNELFLWFTRSRAFERILGMGHSFSNRFPAGDVIERIDQDLGELSWFACSGIFRPVEAFFTIVFALIILIKLNPLLTLISVLPVSLAVVVWLRLGPAIYRWYRQWREKISLVNSLLESSFSGIKLVKSYTMEERSARRVRGLLDERITSAVRVVKAEALIGVWFSGVAELGILLILWVGGILVIKTRLTIGEFVAFNAYILLLITPMFDIGNFFVAGQRAQAGAERILELKNHTPDIADTGRRKAPAAGSITFRGVSFRYDAKNPEVVRAVDLEFKPGRKIGIAGTVGSGKSTIIRLLLRLAEPSRGEIGVDGVDIREIAVRELRSLYGYAPQEAMLFSDTIENNIAFGRPVDAERLAKVIAIAQFSDEVKQFPAGAKEMIGERGLKLSGGQKERVAIARALVTRPRLLIFDDATASLDAETEKRLINDVLAELKDTTLIIVSHRLSVLAVCDTVYVFDKGEIVESGTHDKLLAKRGLYHKLYQHQLMAEEMEKE